MKRQVIIISKDNKKALEFLEKLRGRKQQIKEEILAKHQEKIDKDGKVEIKT